MVLLNRFNLQHAPTPVVPQLLAIQLHIAVRVDPAFANHLDALRIGLVVQIGHVASVRRDVSAPVVGQRVVVDVANLITQRAILTPGVAGHDKLRPFLPRRFSVPNLAGRLLEVRTGVQANLLGRVNGSPLDGNDS